MCPSIKGSGLGLIGSASSMGLMVPLEDSASMRSYVFRVGLLVTHPPLSL
jgi:hypothetical protein